MYSFEHYMDKTYVLKENLMRKLFDDPIQRYLSSIEIGKWRFFIKKCLINSIIESIWDFIGVNWSKKLLLSLIFHKNIAFELIIILDRRLPLKTCHTIRKSDIWDFNCLIIKFQFIRLTYVVWLFISMFISIKNNLKHRRVINFF